MADMTRTDTSIITLTGENESYQRRALEAAIAYQDAMGIPCKMPFRNALSNVMMSFPEPADRLM